MATKKALVLTAGGGRGAYHLGALAALDELGWLTPEAPPDYIAGTSIGSVHAAALAAGRSWRELYDHWLRAMRSDAVQEAVGPEPLRSLLHSFLHGDVTPDGEVVLGGGQGGPLQRWLEARSRDMVAFMMQTNHLYRAKWPEVVAGFAPGIDFDRINGPDAPALVVPAVDVRRGTVKVWCNRPWRDWQGAPQPATRFGPEHLAASASIQMVYQPGPVAEPDSGEVRHYWDGAVAEATPLDALLDVARGEALEIVVVLLSPWHRPGDEEIDLPERLYETFTPALDWMMLAPFRVALKRMADQGRPMPRIIAPSAGFWKRHMALDRVVEYKPAMHEALFRQAYADTMAQFT